jgi:hypothetical protein
VSIAHPQQAEDEILRWPIYWYRRWPENFVSSVALLAETTDTAEKEKVY